MASWTRARRKNVSGYIGKDYMQRQANKRTTTNIKNKVKRLSKKDPHLYQAFIQSVVNSDPDLVQHFLSVLDR